MGRIKWHMVSEEPIHVRKAAKPAFMEAKRDLTAKADT